MPPPRHEPVSGARGGHPEQREPGGAWGATARSGTGAGTGTAYGDWRGAPRTRPATASTQAPPWVPEGDTGAFDTGAFDAPAFDTGAFDTRAFDAPAFDTGAFDTGAFDTRAFDAPAFGTPAAGFPQVAPDSGMTSTGTHRRVAAPHSADSARSAVTSTGSHRRITVPGPGPDADGAFTATGSHRRVSVPGDPLTSTGPHGRIPAPRTPVAPSAPDAEPEPATTGRGLKVRTYAGMAAAAVTTVLAVVVAGQVASEGDGGKTSARAAGDGNSHTAQGNSAASRSDDRPTPAGAGSGAAQAVPELPYEQRMAQQFPIDEKLKGPGTFDTVPGVARAPGKGKVIRYRVDVEQGLGLDAQLFAEAVHRTLNDDRSWGHGGSKTFERVPGGEADFVITLASPGTTGVWCAKSGLDTTVDNVSCDSASTDRVMINAYRWAQGSVTYGADQMFAYRQMLINHEVGHRLGHGHVSCQTPGALAPIMQQQTKSLDINGIHCKPNPWVFPGS
ncbi:DUF3152 domain-containing protein [Streptomyces sp. NBC_00096]|uniref:DUF3152 domain-containing protein n=1 Tax=Streptomyces sp. NBC_00096 TaxID=2975650 RepID=UPI00325320F0